MKKIIVVIFMILLTVGVFAQSTPNPSTAATRSTAELNRAVENASTVSRMSSDVERIRVNVKYNDFIQRLNELNRQIGIVSANFDKLKGKINNTGKATENDFSQLEAFQKEMDELTTRHKNLTTEFDAFVKEFLPKK